jgi:hypothetical protein
MKKSYSNGDTWENGTILTIKKVNAKEHQGNYTCAPSTLTSSSVVVHIIDEGKMPQDAAVYDSFDSSSSSREGGATYLCFMFYSHHLSIVIFLIRCNHLMWPMNNIP